MTYLNTEQKKAVAALKKIGKNWPDGIWLFCNGISMAVMACGPDGKRIMGPDDSVDQNYIVDHIEGIDHDGGDW